MAIAGAHWPRIPRELGRFAGAAGGSISVKLASLTAIGAGLPILLYGGLLYAGFGASDWQSRTAEAGAALYAILVLAMAALACGIWRDLTRFQRLAR